MPSKNQETERIQRVYAAYTTAGLPETKWSLRNPGNNAISSDRSRALSKALASEELLPLSGKRILDVGCGAGGVLRELIGLGADPSLLVGIDLVAHRIEMARTVLPSVDLQMADARWMPFEPERFDLALSLTLFSSILDGETAAQVAHEICRVLKPGGAMIWYDLRFNNPGNPNVRGIKRREVEAWFPGFRSSWRTLTVLPPLARRLGFFTPVLYPILAAIPFIRTHLLGVLIKPTAASRGPA
jgi:ubiquinone/menaquinone biosynthesis C-methylase UbiE